MSKLTPAGTQITKDLYLSHTGDKAAVLNAQTWEFTTVDVFYDVENDGANAAEVLNAYFTKVGRDGEQGSEVIVRYDRIMRFNPVTRKFLNSVLTIAAKIDYAEMTLTFGWSVCSPQDNFCKAAGRELAVSRLGSDEAITIPYNAGMSIRDNIYCRRDENEGVWNRGLTRHLNRTILISKGA